jgi:Ca-activated chloride channel family protein
VAREALATEPALQKVIVLITDGEDLEGRGLAEAKRAAADGVTIDTVGVGTAEGELVPARDARGDTVGVTRDEAGNPVRSRLDEADLEAIAAAAHGTYEPLGADGRGLDRLYDRSLAALTQASRSSRTRRVYAEWFEVPLALSLVGLVLDALLGRRWRRATVKGGRTSRGRANALGLAAAAGLVLALIPAGARASVESAQEAYAARRYDDAAKELEAESARKPKDARLAFNAGDAAYRAGQYAAAEAAFARALAAAEPALQPRVLYNQGDVLYRLGGSRKPEERDQTIAEWKAAIEAYDRALALDPKDEDAKFNRDFVARKLAALEQKDNEPPKNPPSGGDKKDKGDQGNKGGPQNKGDQSPSAPAPSRDQGHLAQNSSAQGSVSPSPSGAPPAPAGNPPGHDKPGQAGRLSPQDARALVGALRGEERRVAGPGADAGPNEDDTPAKDW